MSTTIYSILVPAGTRRCYSGNYTDAITSHIGCSAHNMVLALDTVPQVDPTEVVLYATPTVGRPRTSW